MDTLGWCRYETVMRAACMMIHVLGLHILRVYIGASEASQELLRFRHLEHNELLIGTTACIHFLQKLYVDLEQANNVNSICCQLVDQHLRIFYKHTKPN